MKSIFAKIDDKFVPLYRVIWISEVPHFCGSEDCEAEGLYEIRLESEESVFGSRQERDDLLQLLQQWKGA